MGKGFRVAERLLHDKPSLFRKERHVVAPEELGGEIDLDPSGPKIMPRGSKINASLERSLPL